MGSYGSFAVYLYDSRRGAPRPDGPGRGGDGIHSRDDLQGRRSPAHHRLGSQRSCRPETLLLHRPASARRGIQGAAFHQLALPQRGGDTHPLGGTIDSQSSQTGVQHTSCRTSGKALELSDYQSGTTSRHPLGGARFQGAQQAGEYPRAGQLYHRWKDEIPRRIRHLRRRGAVQPEPCHS